MVHILLLFTAVHCLPLVHRVPLWPIVTVVNKNAWQNNVWLISPWHNWYEACALRRILVLPKHCWLARQCCKVNELFVCIISIYIHHRGHVICFLSPTTTCYFNFAAAFLILVSSDSTTTCYFNFYAAFVIVVSANLTTTCYFNFASAFVIVISADSLSVSHHGHITFYTYKSV